MMVFMAYQNTKENVKYTKNEKSIWRIVPAAQGKFLKKAAKKNRRVEDKQER